MVSVVKCYAWLFSDLSEKSSSPSQIWVWKHKFSKFKFQTHFWQFSKIFVFSYFHYRWSNTFLKAVNSSTLKKKIAVSRISKFWNPICMPGNCSTYNPFYVAVWSLNEALTFNLLSLFQFLFFLNWFDFLKVLFFSLFFSFLWLNQSPCFSSHTTCFSHFFDEVRSQSPWFLIYQLWFELKYTGTHLHWVHWVFAATFTLSEVFVFFFLFI